MAWLLIAAGFGVLGASARLRDRRARRAAQGLAVLLAAAGALTVARRPDAAWQLPGHGPRRWTSP